MATKKKRRVLSGLGAAPKKRRKKAKTTKGRWKSVSKKAATKANGRLKKGCKWKKGGGALCRVGGSTTKRKGKKRGKKSSKSAATGKGHVYSGKPSRSAAYKKSGKKFVLKKGCSKITSGANRGKVVCDRKQRRRKAA